MLVYGIVILAVGIGMFGSTWLLVSELHRRYKLPYALVTVGIITYIGALLAQILLLQVIDRALLGILPVGALAIGLAAGFSEEIARVLGFQYLARSTVTRPQALMISARATWSISWPGAAFNASSLRDIAVSNSPALAARAVSRP